MDIKKGVLKTTLAALADYLYVSMFFIILWWYTMANTKVFNMCVLVKNFSKKKTINIFVKKQFLYSITSFVVSKPRKFTNYCISYF